MRSKFCHFFVIVKTQLGTFLFCTFCHLVNLCLTVLCL